MKSTLFTRGKTRRGPDAPLPPHNGASSSSMRSNGRNKTDLETPASVDDNDIYFDTTPRVTQPMDDEGSRPPPTNPEAISVSSSSFGRSRSGRFGPGSTSHRRRPSSPPLQRSASTRVPPKININTFWAANEEFERKYDLTPVHKEGEDGEIGGSATFSVDPWENGGSSRRGTSSGR